MDKVPHDHLGKRDENKTHTKFHGIWKKGLPLVYFTSRVPVPHKIKVRNSKVLAMNLTFPLFCNIREC